MSVVTNLVLVFDNADDDEKTLEAINKYFKENYHDGYPGFDFVKNYGGTKCYESNVAGGAFNCLDLEELIEHLKSIEWDKDMRYVQLFVKGQHDNKWELINILINEDNFD